MDPYSSPYILPNSSPNNPFPPFPTKHQTVNPEFPAPWPSQAKQQLSS